MPQAGFGQRFAEITNWIPARASRCHTGDGAHNFTPLLDGNSASPPDARYKALCGDEELPPLRDGDPGERELRLDAMPQTLVLFLCRVAIGFVTLLVGMVVVAPLLGYATWHAYRDLIA